MAEPSKKSPAINSAIQDLFGVAREVHIRDDVCVPSPIGCGGPAVAFRDRLSRKEYTISGMCQKCQDSIFGA